ncbi:GntR family transcriptional regulator [Nocardia sp. CNY236]|uniref:GntR family transcriptional regulator n=1 Tax=Nocardia sp. CNY236 TaxID=1169152 RepID=UPI0004057000|nr:GntR family transcriptional regulator [Nocardia sp. CNY236]
MARDIGRIPLREQVYESLRRDLASGAIMPTQRLGEERLAETYGVSRTPVREALARLQADGLVERLADGLYPYRPRLDELDHLYELRIVLETRGMQRVRPGDRRSHALDPIRDELATWLRLRDHAPEPGPALVAADEAFHTTVLAAAGNTALAEALTAVHVRVRPVRTLDVPSPERIATMVADHIAIAEFLSAGAVDAALDRLTAHVDTARMHVRARAQHALRLTKLGRAVRD